MRVLEIVADGSLGGGTTHVLQILKGLQSPTLCFALVTQSESYLHQEAQNLGIPCHGLNFFYSRLNPAIPIELRRICSRTQPHVIHAHGARAAFFLALARIKIPVLYTIHGFHFFQKPRVFRWLALQVERYIFKRASRIIFVSQYDLTCAKNMGILKKDQSYDLIFNGIPFHNVPQIDFHDFQHIGFIGRLEPQKDPLLFLDTLGALPKYSATIVGTGSLDTLVRKEIVRRGLTKRVRMLGALSHSETLKAISLLSVLVLPSRWEGLPLIALEAMWLGVPVVSMNVSGMGEIFDHEIDGVLVDQRTGESLANGIKKVAESTSLRASIIQNAKQKVRGKFSEDQMLQSVCRVYQEI